MIQISLVILHVLSVVFPAIGIGHAAYRKRKPVAEKAVYDRLRSQFEKDKTEALAAGDKNAEARAIERFNESLDRPDRRGRTLRRFLTVRHTSEYSLNDQAYREFRADVAWVILGLLLGGVANVWSTFL